MFKKKAFEGSREKRVFEGSVQKKSVRRFEGSRKAKAFGGSNVRMFTGRASETSPFNIQLSIFDIRLGKRNRAFEGSAGLQLLSC